MKKLMVLVLMAAGILSWAGDKTVPCLYSDNGSKEYDKFGVIWVDKDKGLMCWGPEKPGKDGRREVKGAIGIWQWSGVPCLTSDIRPTPALSASSPQAVFAMIYARMGKVTGPVPGCNYMICNDSYEAAVPGRCTVSVLIGGLRMDKFSNKIVRFTDERSGKGCRTVDVSWDNIKALERIVLSVPDKAGKPTVESRKEDDKAETKNQIEKKDKKEKTDEKEKGE